MNDQALNGQCKFAVFYDKICIKNTDRIISIRDSLENDAKLIMTIERDIVVVLDPPLKWFY